MLGIAGVGGGNTGWRLQSRRRDPLSTRESEVKMSMLLRSSVAALPVILLVSAAPSAQTRPASDAPPHSAAPAGPMFDSSKVKVSLEDRVAIYDLFARYSQSIDMGNGDEMVHNVFAPNGIFHDPSLCLVGSDEIRARLTNHPSHVKTSEHWPNNIVITEMSPSNDRAKVHSYVFLVGPRGIGVVGTYHDTLIKTNGKWLILDREVYRPGEIKLDPRCPVDLSTIEP
jgi:hypothetical protein